jgi:hypothetical protein
MPDAANKRRMTAPIYIQVVDFMITSVNLYGIYV